MAKYRQVHIEFWQDGFVLELTPEEKYFYLYLMTNSKTTQCGIYELPKRIMETETGYNRETVDKLINRFTEYGKIIYHEPTREIMLVNWIKFNWISSPKVVSLINKELKQVKNKHFIKLFIDKCLEYGYRIDNLSIPYADDIQQKNEKSGHDKGSIPYQYSTDRPSIDLGGEVEEEREREVEREQEREGEVEEEREPATSSTDAIVFYQNNFGLIKPYISEEMLYWIEDLGDEMVIEAMRRSLDRNKPSWGYAKSIIQSWSNKGIKTIEQAKAEEVEFQNQQAAKKPNYQNKSNEVVPDWFKERKQKNNTPKQEVDPEEWEDTEQLLKKYSRKAGGDS